MSKSAAHVNMYICVWNGRYLKPNIQVLQGNKVRPWAFKFQTDSPSCILLPLSVLLHYFCISFQCNVYVTELLTEVIPWIYPYCWLLKGTWDIWFIFFHNTLILMLSAYPLSHFHSRCFDSARLRASMVVPGTVLSNTELQFCYLSVMNKQHPL